MKKDSASEEVRRFQKALVIEKGAKDIRISDGFIDGEVENAGHTKFERVKNVISGKEGMSKNNYALRNRKEGIIESIDDSEIQGLDNSGKIGPIRKTKIYLTKHPTLFCSLFISVIGGLIVLLADVWLFRRN